jgi:hypothetical protein
MDEKRAGGNFPAARKPHIAHHNQPISNANPTGIPQL